MLHIHYHLAISKLCENFMFPICLLSKISFHYLTLCQIIKYLPQRINCIIDLFIFVNILLSTELEGLIEKCVSFKEEVHDLVRTLFFKSSSEEYPAIVY